MSECKINYTGNAARGWDWNCNCGTKSEGKFSQLHDRYANAQEHLAQKRYSHAESANAEISGDKRKEIIEDFLATKGIRYAPEENCFYTTTPDWRDRIRRIEVFSDGNTTVSSAEVDGWSSTKKHGELKRGQVWEITSRSGNVFYARVGVLYGQPVLIGIRYDNVLVDSNPRTLVLDGSRCIQ